MIVSWGNLFVPDRFRMPDWRWWKSHRRRRPSLFLGNLRICPCCYSGVSSSLAGHGTCVSTSYCMNSFSPRCFCLVPPGGPTGAPSRSSLLQLALSLGQQPIQSQNLLLSLSELTTLFCIKSTVHRMTRHSMLFALSLINMACPSLIPMISS